jgi:hypothetical protein
MTATLCIRTSRNTARSSPFPYQPKIDEKLLRELAELNFLREGMGRDIQRRCSCLSHIRQDITSLLSLFHPGKKLQNQGIDREQEKIIMRNIAIE